MFSTLARVSLMLATGLRHFFAKDINNKAHLGKADISRLCTFSALTSSIPDRHILNVFFYPSHV